MTMNNSLKLLVVAACLSLPLPFIACGSSAGANVAVATNNGNSAAPAITGSRTMKVSKAGIIKLIFVGVFAAGAGMLFFTQGMGAASAAGVDDLANPRTLYSQNCARCHGADGKAQTSLGRKYNADDISGGVGTGKTIRIVTNGKGHMPSFKKKLTAAQISQIADYVKGL